MVNQETCDHTDVVSSAIGVNKEGQNICTSLCRCGHVTVTEIGAGRPMPDIPAEGLCQAHQRQNTARGGIVGCEICHDELKAEVYSS